MVEWTDMNCMQCEKPSTLYFQLVDNFGTPRYWCPACVYKLMKANQQYIEGVFKGDQDKHQMSAV